MSSTTSTRFPKGQSGNPKGRPKKRRPDVSAFDIIFDKTLTVTQNGVERELTVDEALQLQTYQAALKGSRMSVRAVLKMIEKRELAIAKLNPAPSAPVKLEYEHDSDNADEALLLLGIAELLPTPDGAPSNYRQFRLATWAAQFGISRAGRRQLSDKDREDIKRFTLNPEKLRWPRRRGA
jgi:hypothetical protein